MQLRKETDVEQFKLLINRKADLRETDSRIDELQARVSETCAFVEGVKKSVH